MNQHQLLGELQKAIAAGDTGYVEKIKRVLTSIGDEESLAQIQVLTEKREAIEESTESEYCQQSSLDLNAKNNQKLGEINGMATTENIQVEIQATEGRHQFVEFLSRMTYLLTDVEEKLGLESQQTDLKQKSEVLKKGVFRFLVVGDFNRGKSTILNVLLGEQKLPTGRKPTTAIPTFMQYGSKEIAKVCYKSGKVEELSLKEFNEKYTLKCKWFNQKLKQLQQSASEFLAPIEHAIFELPVKLLQEGVEFIDTAGLNNSPEENEKTLSYIEKSHVVIFILSPVQPVTLDEKNYLENHIRRNVKTVFFLINGWENLRLKEEEYQEIREEFTTKLSRYLKITEDEVLDLWGKRIFDVYALDATEKLEKGESIEGTGFKDFTIALNQFLERERLAEELSPSVNAMNAIGYQVLKRIDEQLNNGKKEISQLEEDIKAVAPYYEIMEEIVSNFPINIGNLKKECATDIKASYERYFREVCDQFDQDFTEVPILEDLSESSRDKFRMDLQQACQEYIQSKLYDWNKEAEAKIRETFDEIGRLFDEKNSKYQRSQRRIEEILEGSDKEEVRGTKLDYKCISQDEVSLQVAESNTAGSVIGGGYLGLLTGGTASGVGAVALHAALVFIPAGWFFIAGSVASAALGAFLGKQLERKKFINNMKNQLVKELPTTILSNETLEKLDQHVSSLFDRWNEVSQNWDNQIKGYANSLNNLIEAKKSGEFDFEAEERQLTALRTEMVSLLQDIERQYSKYLG